MLAPVVGLALGSRGGPLPGDERLLHAWSSSTNALTLVNVLASIQVWSVLVVLIGVCLWAVGQRHAASVLIVAGLSGEVLAFLVKAIVMRPRPTDVPWPTR